MEILKDLYYGHIDIIGRNSMDSPEYRRCVENAAECEKEITQYSPEADALFLKYQEAQGRLNSMTEYEMFAAGFRMGAQLMLEMLRQ